MLNTFFFGYLSPKWKRLARVLSFVLIILLPIVFTALEIPSYHEEESNLLGFITAIIIVPITSYTLKPFVVKED